jgi:hypothetical protein
MGKHKSTDKIELTVVTNVERTHLERGFHLEAFMFHYK